MTEPAPILLSPPHLGEAERALLLEAFDSNWIAPLGPQVDAFERELADELGAGNVCALASGTAAIHLGLLLLGVKPGDLVLCSSLTFVASANPILLCGAEPVFIDADPDDWCMSPIALERALKTLANEGKTPRACVAVSLYGQMAQMEAIQELCAQYGVKLLDEAAEALGATRNNRNAGTFGDLGVFSFNGNKIITTSGGGALWSADKTVIEHARFLASQARDDSEAMVYEHTTMGFNYRLSNLLAAVGRGQLQVLADRVEARRAIFARYRDALAAVKELSWMPEPPACHSTRWLSACLLAPTVDRARVVAQLRAASIDARPVWKPMHQQLLFANARFFPHENTCDVSSELFAHGLCLPSGSSLSAEDQHRVISVLKNAICSSFHD